MEYKGNKVFPGKGMTLTAQFYVRKEMLRNLLLMKYLHLLMKKRQIVTGKSNCRIKLFLISLM